MKRERPLETMPLHVQLLHVLKRRIEERQRQLEARTGTGLPDMDYQRHVGRIAECKTLAEEIDQLLKGDVDELESFLDQEEKTRGSQNKRR